MSVGQAALRYRIDADELVTKINQVIAEAEEKKN